MSDGTITPDGCRYCGIDQRAHAVIWAWDIGWHGWASPTDEQRLERMRARRATAAARAVSAVPPTVDTAHRGTVAAG